jgi:hypothetical protein
VTVQKYDHVVTLASGEKIRHYTTEGWLQFDVSHAGALLVYKCQQTPYEVLRTLAGAYAPGHWLVADRLLVD